MNPPRLIAGFSNHKLQADRALGVPPVCVCAILCKRKTPAPRSTVSGQKESPHMSDSPIGPTAQVGLGNPHLITFLRLTLSDQGWDMQRLASAMRWNQEVRAEMTEVAIELGLIAPPLIRARPVSRPATADILIFPVSPRPRSES